ncbi:DUF883 family protein [Salinicola avicenniae]|uniref:DUF883 family protein n=1 Tax=Salinicola avicenniae TaxID=2916836 RepID=UPI002074256B|nr:MULTISPECIES: hypothetical protein [unclassified Salinicola]
MSLFRRGEHRADTDRLRDDVRDIGDQGRALGRDLLTDAEDAIEAARQQSEAQYARLAADARRQNRRLKQSAARGRSTAGRTANDCDRYVREHPWAGIGIAAVAGTLVGLFVGRR